MSGDTKQVYDAFVRGWNASITAGCGDKYFAALAMGKRLGEVPDFLDGEELEGWIVGVTSRWAALGTAAQRCGYDPSEELAREHQWFIRAITRLAERGLDRIYSFIDAREGVGA